MVRALTGVLLCFLLAPVVRGQTRAADPAAKSDVPLLVHIELRGDLDSIRMVRDLSAAIDRHRDAAKSPPTILLEPTGRRWRDDVVAELASALSAEPRCPLLVLLNGSSGQPIGTGQAYFALLADAAYTSPRTRVAFSESDALDDLRPVDHRPDAALDALRTSAWPTLTSRGASPLLLALVPRPSTALWAVLTGEGDGSLRIVAQTPEPGTAARPVVSVREGRAPTLTTLDAQTLTNIGMVSGTVHGVGDLLSKRNLSVWRTEQVRIESTLGAARRSLGDGLRDVDLGIASVKAALDATREKTRSKNAPLIEQARQSARQQTLAIDRLTTRVQDLEGLTAEYPELLRSTAPGSHTLPASAAQNTAAWASCFQDRRDELGKLRSRAQTIAATPDP